MFTRILVPVDGSERSWQALTWAERLASHAPAEVFVLQVISPLGGLFSARPTPALLVAAAREQEHQTESATTALSNAVHALHGRDLRASRYVEVGDAALKILEFIAQHGIDLVVMGTRGRGGVSRAILGSVADEVRRQAVVPVLMVPHQATPPLGNPAVLICLDQSLEAENALHAGIELAAGLKASAVLFEVAQGSIDPAAALTYLEALADASRVSGVQISTVTGGGDPGPAILLHADIMQASVIAVASHGRSGVTRAVLGSVASHVIEHSRIPVLLTHRHLQDQQRETATALAAGIQPV